MKREIRVTADGSHTIAIPEQQVNYHSRHGAIQESNHVFIQAGLHHVLNTFQSGTLHVFEMGFGTGLNALLTAIEAMQQMIPIHYTAVEQFPLTLEEAAALNYGERLQQKALFTALHECAWNEDVQLNEWFTLRKVCVDLLQFTTAQRFHLIFYDAFAPDAQPELWTTEIFCRMQPWLLPNSVLVTYSSKGAVRRALIVVGFSVEKLPGPPGKREMLRATVNSTVKSVDA